MGEMHIVYSFGGKCSIPNGIWAFFTLNYLTPIAIYHSRGPGKMLRVAMNQRTLSSCVYQLQDTLHIHRDQ